MNSLWPATSRISCLNIRTFFQACYKVDSLAARLAQRSIRPYSKPSLPFRRSNTHSLGSLPSNRSWQAQSLFHRLPDAIRTFASRRIITKFEHLPRDYTDEHGLEFRAEPLSKAETTMIFGKVVDAKFANTVLMRLHGRRVAGTLEDPQYPNTLERQFFENAMAWLRENVPVDEVQCAGLRAEKELAAMEEEIVSDAERIGLYKPNSGKRKNVYGKSGLEAIRKANEKEFDRKQALKKKSQADEVRQNTGTLEKVRPKSFAELRQPSSNPKIKYYLERAQELKELPDMTTFQRLWPSGLFVLGLVLISYLGTQIYTPPRREWRMWPDMPPSAATVIAIMTTNAFILLFWRVPPLMRVLNKFFIAAPGYPRAFSMIGNVFSHQTASHFATNMAILWFVGTRLHEEIGRADFLAIYLSAGAIGSFASLTSWVLRSNFVSASLGASGAVSGVVAAYLLLKSSENLTIFGYPSLSGLQFLCILIGMEILSMRKVKVITIDHWAHLGGYATGIAASQALKMKARQKEAIEVERRKNLGFVERLTEPK